MAGAALPALSQDAGRAACSFQTRHPAAGRRLERAIARIPHRAAAFSASRPATGDTTARYATRHRQGCRYNAGYPCMKTVSSAPYAQPCGHPVGWHCAGADPAVNGSRGRGISPLEIARAVRHIFLRQRLTRPHIHTQTGDIRAASAGALQVSATCTCRWRDI